MDSLILKSLEEFVDRSNVILDHSILSAYCYGSAIYDDFSSGYSDLDFFIITETTITELMSDCFALLRTELRNSNDPYLPVLEGEIISKDAIRNDTESNVIYWGGSGHKLNRRYELSGFSLRGLINKGYLIQGEDMRAELPYPGNTEMLSQVNSMIETVRKYAQGTDESIHSMDWLFLICQSIYWLKTFETTGKTNASQWIINNCDYSWSDTLRKAIAIRQSPALATLNENKLWLKSLGGIVQNACDTLTSQRNDFVSRLGF